MDTTPIKNLIIESKGAISPDRLSEIAVELSSWYATISEKWSDIEVFRAERELAIRETVKSDRMAEKTYLASPEGKDWNRLRIQLKALEKHISSIKLRLRVKETEAYGRY